MKKHEDMVHFEPAEKVVQILKNKTQNDNSLFFRVLVAYYFTKVASMMRTNIKTHDRGVIPVGMYALNLSTSGSGKGYSTNMVEEQVINQFRDRFTNETFPKISEKNLAKLAIKRSIKTGEDDETSIQRVTQEFEDLGALLFSFDDASPQGVKQMRHKLLMSKSGSVNLEIDEIGSNLLGSVPVLNTFLELYDVGKIKQKLIKNTGENKRNEDIDGRTPTNMMLFGTPNKLLNGGKIEEEFYSMLNTGYARRCIFGYHKKPKTDITMSPEEIYDMLTDTAMDEYLLELSTKLGRLADPVNFGQTLTLTKDVALQLIEYKLDCDIKSDAMKEHEEIMKSEMSHRYYKALKLAGAYAFIDGSFEVAEDHLHHAIKLVEESGEAFKAILTRERNYVKLAKYISEVGREITQVDLVEDLPFYRGSAAQKNEQMALAIAYGYKNNIIIKKSFSDGIEFLQGESMDVTDLDKMQISYSQNITENFQPDIAPFSDLHKLVKASGYHYAAHKYIDGYRNSSNLIPGFNLVILDVDHGITLSAAQNLLKDYKALFSTTKSHTKQTNRFRIILPLSHTVKLKSDAYSKFMENVFNWLPFEVDTATKDCARKWESFNGDHHYQDGDLLDATLFIPQTRKEEEQTKTYLDNNGLSNMERWFHLNTNSGNRSDHLVRYALILVDNGYSIENIRNSVLQFNSKLKDQLEEEEVNNTILITAMKAVTKRDIALSNSSQP